MSTPRSFHGSAAGSFSANTLISSPSTDDRIVAGLDVALIRAVHRVVLEQVRERFRIGEIVHRDEVDVRHSLLLRRAKHLTPDAAEPVDANANRHPVVLLVVTTGRRVQAPGRRSQN